MKILWVKFVQVGSSTMRYLDMFKSSLNSALDRKYFLDWWISVDSLVTLLQQNYDLDFLNKRYVNKYILTLFLKDYKVYKHSILRLKNHIYIIPKVDLQTFKQMIYPIEIRKVQWSLVILCMLSLLRNNHNLELVSTYHRSMSQ